MNSFPCSHKYLLFYHNLNLSRTLIVVIIRSSRFFSHKNLLFVNFNFVIELLISCRAHPPSHLPIHLSLVSVSKNIVHFYSLLLLLVFFVFLLYSIKFSQGVLVSVSTLSNPICSALAQNSPTQPCINPALDQQFLKKSFKIWWTKGIFSTGFETSSKPVL